MCSGIRWVCEVGDKVSRRFVPAVRRACVLEIARDAIIGDCVAWEGSASDSVAKRIKGSQIQERGDRQYQMRRRK